MNDESDDESDGDGDDVQIDTSKDTTIDIVGVDDEPSTVQKQPEPSSPKQVHPQQTLDLPTTVHLSLLKSLQEQLKKLQKQVDDQKNDVETFKVYNIDAAVKH